MAASCVLSRRSRSGMATAFFSLISLSFGLIGAAQLFQAAQVYRRERQDLNRMNEQFAADAIANLALARLLVSRGDGPFVGDVQDAGSTYRVAVERDDLKRATERRMTPQAQLDAARREGRDTSCLYTRVSPVAGGATAASRAPSTELAVEGEIDWRPGQRWRVSVLDTRGVAAERWYLLSGRADQPALEIARGRHRVDPVRWRRCGEGVDDAA